MIALGYLSQEIFLLILFVFHKIVHKKMEKYGSLDEKKWKNMEVWISKCKQINATFINNLSYLSQ